MPDGEVQEVTQSDQTKGKIAAFHQILEDLKKRQEALPDRISGIQGEARAFATMSERIQGLITQRIHKLSAQGRDREQIKDEQEFSLSIKQLCAKCAQESINEKIRLEGEARAMLFQVEVIANLSKKALADERTLQALEDAQEPFRAQVELARQKGEQKAEEEKAQKKKKSNKSKKKKKEIKEKKEIEPKETNA